jgi:hypothetical protein
MYTEPAKSVMKHAPTLAIEREANTLHQVGEQNLRSFAGTRCRVHGCAIHRIASGRVTSIGPVHHPVLCIELEIDGLRQIFVKHLDVRAIRGYLAQRNIDVGTTDAALELIRRPPG